MNGDILAIQFIWGVSGSSATFAPARKSSGIIGGALFKQGAVWLMTLL